MSRSLGWYARRLQQMSLQEVAHRGSDQLRRSNWAHRQVRLGDQPPLPQGLLEKRVFASPLPPEARTLVPEDVRDDVLSAAKGLLAGDWSILGTPRPDIADPDWFLDPVTGRRAPHDRLAFRIDHRDENETGNIKSVWELSRHHHLTVLASAWWLTGEDAYADAVAEQLTSWFKANPFLTGVHWTSGIEIGVRLTSWAWIRRLLNDWPKVGDLFDENPDALRQIWWHQTYLAAFRSRGSSANNHVVAEAAGQLVAACAFPWYAESDAWQSQAARLLETELAANTFESGINRELATDYQRFVAELALVAAVEADAAERPLGSGTWALLTASLDAAASILDAAGRPPRQGDGDEGRALVLDDPDTDPWGLLLSAGAEVIGPMQWWPDTTPGVFSVALGALAHKHDDVAYRPEDAPDAMADAGVYLLRTPSSNGPEIWCRCDGGPHGFLSIAAHAHADALSVEVRYAGTEVLVDPGTYCYHGESQWRSYFRSTLAHNTLEIAGENQSVETGPFMWTAHAKTEVDGVDLGSTGPQVWSAHHSGYERLEPGAVHGRTVTLDPSSRHLEIVDRVTSRGTVPLKVAFHLGPEVHVRLSGPVAELTWSDETGAVSADLHLPGQLRWTAHTGETEPVLGWYSPRFGERVPITTLIGHGVCQDELDLHTLLVFPSV